MPENYDKQLSVTQKELCEGLITEEELLSAIMSFKEGKTPGLDGIPIEVYQKFFDLVKKPLLSCFNFTYDVGYLSNSQKEGLISLLLKQQSNGQYKDPVHLKNWRSITLQCYDAKILANA